MQNIQDLEKILNSELNTKIKSSLIKHNQIYLKIDEANLTEVILFLKTNSKTEVCGFGLENKLDLINGNNNFMSNFYINYENLNLGARHEYGVRLKIEF